MRVVLALLLVALIAGVTATNPTCDFFAIRNRGETLFFIDSKTGVLGVPNDLEVGTVWTSNLILGDYLLNVYPTDSGEMLGIRKRLVDETTGKYKVPRSVLQFALDGTHVIYNDEIRDVSEFTLYELADYLRLARADEMALEGVTDPFNVRWGYNPAGEFCKDGIDCVSAMDDLFEEITLSSSGTVHDTLMELTQLADEFPQAGETGYDGEIQSINFQPIGMGRVSVSNDVGKTYGQAGFRLTNEEVEDVFILIADIVGDWELTPGVKVPVLGWKGGQVLDFEFDDDGALVGGHVVVGPFPDTDEANDKITWTEEDGWMGLQTQVPGPALRFGFLRRTRMYIWSIPADPELGMMMQPFSPAFIGLDIPYDQHAIRVMAPMAEGKKRQGGGDNIVVYEFIVHTVGPHLYTIWEAPGGSLAGPLTIEDPSSPVVADREYMIFPNQINGFPVLNGNTFPGTARRLNGLFRDVMAISSSEPGEDENGNPGTIVTIMNQPRPPVVGGDSDPLFPTVAHECPAYGGPLVGRIGTGCGGGDDHQHASHQITSTTLNPGTLIEIWDHLDYTTSQTNSINGQHRVIRIDESSFFIPLIGMNGTMGGTGGYVGVWRLHKADYERPEIQNNGASGGYFRFNYGEKIHMRFVNGLCQASFPAFPFHIHGHQWVVFAEDGFQVENPSVQQDVTLPAGRSFDVLIGANNPNRYGSWLFSANQPEYLTFDLHPWPEAPANPGGLMAYIDYTGDRQGAQAVSDEMIVRSFWELPPICMVENESIQMYRDHRGFGYDHTQYLELQGDATWVNAPYDFVDLDGPVDFSWTLMDSPEGSVVTAFETEAGQDKIRHFYGFDVAGDYTFVFRAQGHLSNRGADEFNWCEKTVVVNVPEDESASEDVEVLYQPWSVHIAPSDDSQDAMDTGALGRNYPRGQATFKLREASARFAMDQNQFDVSYWQYGFYFLTDWFEIDAEDEYDNGGFTFYRWPAAGSDDEHPDYWYNVDFELTRTESQYHWAIKRAVFDSRVSTFGYVIATDLGNGVDAGDMPDEVSRVVYPLWQGASTSGGSFNSRHDVYFLITQSSDEEFCEWYGCVYIPSLSSVPVEALNEVNLYRAQGEPSVKNAQLANRMNTGTFAQDRATEFLFDSDPGLVPTVDPDTEVGAAYSPLKHFRFVGADGVSRSVVANMPFVYWGLYRVQSEGDLPTADAIRMERKMLIVDEILQNAEDEQVYCNPYIRVYPYNVDGVDDWHEDGNADDFTSGFWGDTQSWRDGTYQAWGGPPGCNWRLGANGNLPGQRAMGGQLLDVPNFRKMYAVFKLHRASAPMGVDAVAYYSITDTNDYATAQFYGIIWSRKLSMVGTSSDENMAVARFSWVNNGVMQDAVIPAVPGSDDFSGLWHVTHLFWNCGTYQFQPTPLFSGEAYQTVVIADVIDTTVADPSWRNQFNFLNFPADYVFPVEVTSAPDDFYPLSAAIKTTWCPEYVSMQTGRESGMLYPEEIQDLVDAGVLLETEHPAGSESVSPDNDRFVLFNANVPVLFYYMDRVNKEDWVPSLDDLYDYDWYRLASERVSDADGFQSYEDNYPDNFPKNVFFPGTWALLYRLYNTALPAGSWTGYDEVIVSYFPPTDTDENEGFWHYPTAWLDMPPMAIRTLPESMDPQWISNYYFYYPPSYGDGTLDANDPALLLDLDALYAWESNTDILYAIVECDDAMFAEMAGAAFTPALSLLDERATTWSHYWEEPEANSDGEVDPEDFEAALRSFVFYEQPPYINVNDANNDLWASLYTPFKRFSFQHRTVTCNMPFYTWGEEEGQTMEMAPSNCVVAGNCHPPLDNTLAQVLDANTDRRDNSVATLNALDFTVKLHRAVRYDDDVYPYFALFDISNGDMANLYGVPTSTRTTWANRASLENGVTTLHLVFNGPECTGCFETTTTNDFQEPLAPPSAADGGLVTPLHQIMATLYTCAGGPDVICNGPYDDAVDAGVLDREPGAPRVIYTSDIEPLIDGGYIVLLDEPMMADLIMANTPFIAQVTYPMPPVPEDEPTPGEDMWEDRKANGMTYIFLATRTSLAWRLIDGVANADYDAMDISIVDSRWFPTEDDASIDFGMGSATVHFVTPGDRVVLYVLSDNTITPHGFVAGMIGEDRDAAEDLWMFFEQVVAEDEEAPEYDYATEARFVDTYGSDPYGFTGYAFGPFTLFDGYVREVRAGTTLFVTSSVYGPMRMSIALVVGDYE